MVAWQERRYAQTAMTRGFAGSPLRSAMALSLPGIILAEGMARLTGTPLSHTPRAAVVFENIPKAAY